MKVFSQEDHPLSRNSSTGNASQKALVAGGSDPFSSEDKFIREVLQNSCDAAISPDENVFVHFRACNLDKSQEDAWNTELGISSHLRPRIQLAVPDFPQELKLETVLFIEDYATTGLLYEHPKHLSESRFYRFFFGSGDNEDQTGSGGSFGYGKAVYTDNSRIRTIVAYSCTIEGGHPIKRIFGITRTKKYEYEDRMYSGYIYHGRLDAGLDGERTQPISGEDADLLAAKLGFRIRDGQETGTSIAVLGLDGPIEDFLEAIKHSTEVFWWKKIADKQLTVEFESADGKVVNACPRDNILLEPFLTCYEVSTGRREKPDQQKSIYKEYSLNATGGLGFSPGKVSLLELQCGTESAPDTESILINSVALFRSSGMVIEYRKPGGTSDTGKYVAGVFIANDRLNELLRSSEPASHWGWNENSARIAELGAFRDLNISPSESKQLVKSVKERIDRRFNEFRDKLGETAQVTQASFRSLDKLMTELLGSGKNPGSGGSSSRGVSIINNSFSLIESKYPYMEQYQCEVILSLDDEAPDNEKDLLVKHYIEVKGDDAANSIINRLQSAIIETDAILVTEAASSNEPIYRITKQPSRFVFRTEPVSPRFHRETETVVTGVA